MSFNSILSAAVGSGALLSFFVLVTTSNHEAQAKVWTTENCVMKKWEQWEDIRGEMPTREEEQMFRDECWDEMGAKNNEY